jgi:hypothetical protein
VRQDESYDRRQTEYGAYRSVSSDRVEMTSPQVGGLIMPSGTP